MNHSADMELLQVATMNLKAGQEFTPHVHRQLERTTFGTQEAWIVVSGKIQADYYDTSRNLIASRELGPGDVTVTHRGGHNYKCLEASYVVEIKNGPYHNPELDKLPW